MAPSSSDSEEKTTVQVSIHHLTANTPDKQDAPAELAGGQVSSDDDTHDETTILRAQKRRREEARLVRKLDCYVAPVMAALMLISYLDRGNIGFAATQGMAAALGLQKGQLNTAVSVFYVSYILVEFPMALLAKRLRFHRVLPAITLGWGLVCLGTGFVRGYWSLVLTRVLLGVFEGCLFPTMTLFLCDWYKREELAVRVSYLLSE